MNSSDVDGFISARLLYVTFITQNKDALQMNQQRFPFHDGFTLAEFLIVLFLVALLTLITIPSLLELLARHQAESYMHQLRQTLNMARIKAVSEGQILSICPRQGNQCQSNWTEIPIEIFSGDISNTHSASSTKVWRVIQSPPKAHQLRYSRTLLQFRQDGSLNSLQNGTFQYCPENYDWHLTLSFSQAGRSQTSIENTPCA